MDCDHCGVDCTDDYERINEDTVYCVECWERKCDAYEARIEAIYYREDRRFG